MVSASESKPNMLFGMNPALSYQPTGTLRLAYEDYDITNPVNVVMPILTGTVNRTAGATLLTGTGTLFTAELNPGDYITYYDGFSGLPNTQVVSRVAIILNDLALEVVDGAIQPLSGPTNFINGPCWLFDPNLIPAVGTLDAIHQP
jgi:hypothetical protein